jgi:hypothetical protein
MGYFIQQNKEPLSPQKTKNKNNKNKRKTTNKQINKQTKNRNDYHIFR